ncbi:MAG: hypothetical protein ACMUJM_03170 [bacterium]
MTKQMSNKNILVFRIVWILLVLCIAIFLYFSYRPYLSVPQYARHHTSLHETHKPSGTIGHGLGIVGSVLMLLCYLLYFFRKRFEFLECFGTLSMWLEIHIFLGILGPLLILFHSALKFNGIIGIAFWSMVIVVLSGIFGRVIFGYAFFNISKKYELLHTIDIFIEKDLREASVYSPVIKNVLELHHPGFPTSHGPIETFRQWTVIKREVNKLFAEIDERYGQAGAPDYEEIQRWATELIKRLREIDTISTLNLYLSILDKWVIIHKIFSYIMFIIMFLHIGVTLYWGYSWIV